LRHLKLENDLASDLNISTPGEIGWHVPTNCISIGIRRGSCVDLGFIARNKQVVGLNTLKASIRN